MKIKRARFAGGAFPQTRASPRPLRGKSIGNYFFSYFPLARRAVRFFPSFYHVLSFRSLAALPGRAPIITPFNVVSLLRGFGASAKRGEKGEKHLKTLCFFNVSRHPQGYVPARTFTVSP